jgi:hypothetical protein
VLRVPGERKLLKGDLVKLDVTGQKDGFMADAASRSRSEWSRKKGITFARKLE